MTALIPQQVKYCNLGTTLASADMTSDGWDDLILGSPYAPGGGEQRGELAVVASSPGLTGESTLF